MYVAFGNRVVDSLDFKKLIEDNSNFKVLKDMSKGSKREDVVALNLSLSVDILKEILSDDYDINELTEDELFEELLGLFTELGTDLEEFMPDDSVINVESYKWDESDNDVRGIIVIVHEEFSEGKLKDITRRLLTQVEIDYSHIKKGVFSMEIFTIGHSNYDVERLIDMLRFYNINCVVDIRGTPYSKYNIQYNKEIIQKTLEREGFIYIYMAKELAAKRINKVSYNDEGYSDFEKVVQERRI